MDASHQSSANLHINNPTLILMDDCKLWLIIFGVSL